MRSLSTEGAENLTVRHLAVALAGGALQKDYFTEACRCLAFVRERVRYVRDPYTAELLQGAMVTLPPAFSPIGIGAGDCDDKSILLAALLSSIGHRMRFIAIATDPDHFSHVWVQDWIRGRWIDLEATEDIPCGSRVPEAGAVGYLTREI